MTLWRRTRAETDLHSPSPARLRALASFVKETYNAATPLAPTWPVFAALWLLAAGMGLAFAQHCASTALGLPALSEHNGTPQVSERIDLGRRLFFDSRLSANGKISCASCHDPDKAFSDGLALARGIKGRTGTRNTPSVLNAGYNVLQFWDGRRASLDEQVLDPLTNPNEHGLSNLDEALQRIRADEPYRVLFAQSYAVGPDQIDSAQVSNALATYIRSLSAGDSRVDRFLYAGDKAALSTIEVRGLELFRGRAQCASCHPIGEGSALFTDGGFHSLAIGFDRISSRLAGLGRRIAATPRARLDQLVLEEPDVAALGRFVVTLDPRDIGKFKSPSLRNVAMTAPYMHDGSIATLEEAVDHEIYYRSQTMGRPLVLTPTERSDLVTFLRALTSPHTPR